MRPISWIATNIEVVGLLMLKIIRSVFPPIQVHFWGCLIFKRDYTGFSVELSSYGVILDVWECIWNDSVTT